MPLMAGALATEGIMDAPTLRRFALLALASGLAGYAAPRGVLSLLGALPRWWTLGLAVSAAALAAAIALLAIDRALRDRVARLLRRTAT